VTFRWQLRTRPIDGAGDTPIMGILNVTPDSFSDGGRYLDPAVAVERGRALVAEGAAIVDVGGESTRPGADPVPEVEELRRVVPVVEALAAEGVVVSIDTMKPVVAEAAIRAGAEIVNDVTGLGHPDMVRLCAEHGVGVVVMHMQGGPRTMQDHPTYADVVAEVGDYLERRAAAAEAAGIERDRIVVDPGIGFGKTLEHNLALLANAGAVGRGRPVMVGHSRKRFLGALAGVDEASDRDEATAIVSALAVEAGAALVRVHDVARTGLALRLRAAIVGAGNDGESER
jgi:dihydropteroate synthase